MSPSSVNFPEGSSTTRTSVVVTGVGLITGFNDRLKEPKAPPYREVSWQGIQNGRSAIRRLDWPSLEGQPAYLGAPAPTSLAPDRETIHDLLSILADEALADAGLIASDLPPIHDRTAVLLGLSKGGIRSLRLLAEQQQAGMTDDLAAARHWFSAWPSHGASLIAGRFGFRGPCSAPIAACATGLVAVIQGADLIRRGACDIVLAGSADASIEPLLLAAFRRMKALARDDSEPMAALRPWDRRRSGFVIGEGGAVLVLERADHARARGILPYAEVKGGALGADAYHETDLNPDPSGLAGLIIRALNSARVSSSELDYVNVHGTATRVNDPLECQAIRLALGADADQVSCSANKSQIGHLLGAAGAAELAITCLAIRDGFVPPTLNLDEPDPACDLDGTPHVGRSRPIRTALKLSLGFGGHLAALVLASPDGPRRTPWIAPDA